jgi:hypothetical protein
MAAAVAHPQFGKKATPEAVRRFELRVDAITTRERVSRRAAIQRAREEYPEEFSAYQAA